MMVAVPGRVPLLPIVVFAAGTLCGQSYSAPAGTRPAVRHSGASILPGGRVIASSGVEYPTGPGAFGVAISPSGKFVATANTGPGRNSLTLLERQRNGNFEARQILPRQRSGDEPEGEENEWRGVFMGLVFHGERGFYASEGNSGRISYFDTGNGDRHRFVDLNQGGFADSYSGDLALDAERNLLYAADQANFRIAVIDIKSKQVVASLPVGRLPFALALSPDRKRLYCTNIGMFRYEAIPGADRKQAKSTGLAFPAFGFPSAESAAGVEGKTERGTVKVPGLGDPNVRESNSLAVIDVTTPTAPKIETFVRTGLPFGAKSDSGSSPSGVIATAGSVYVSNAANDSITIVDAKTNEISGEIPIRIPGLETLRGVLPVGLAFDEQSGWLFVAEAGINSVAVIDPKAKKVLGHIPTAWFPTRVAVHGETLFVTNARGHGIGQNVNAPRNALREGTLSVIPISVTGDLPAQTAIVMEANGFRARPVAERPVPAGVKHVVLIVKENRTYDEVFGDVLGSAGAPLLARLGTRGFVDGKRQRLSIKDVNVTPNHHTIARQWTLGDNFYADSDVSVDGHHWLVGSYPNVWTESSLLAAYGDQKKDFRLGTAPGRLLFAGSDSSVHPEDQVEGGTIWHHFTRHGISFYNFGEGFELAGIAEDKNLEPTGGRFLTNIPMPDPLYRNTSREYPGFNMNIPDQFRANQFIHEMEEKYVKGGAELPQFLFIHLPNDHMTKERPDDGYPYEESFTVDNDYALGRILQFLSGTKWWKEMAVFVTEDDAQGGVDHIDAQRTVLMCAGPWIQRAHVTHTNTSFPGLLKTIFRLLGAPPLNLYDASATDLSDVFTNKPDFTPYKLVPVDARLFDPAAAKQAPPGTPSPKMDK
jgi:DNA-binding beta-propeller fold protein YncE